ncbi:MAG: 2-amino-4-hydroxy-6-hydroxymethyldihydropteridine diphosphokinase [Thermoanaerobaculia bacterium]
MSSQTTSASASTDVSCRPVVLGLGANLGPRLITLRKAIDGLSRFVRIVRVSSIYETEPIDSAPGAPSFLNLVVAGVTSLDPLALLEQTLKLEQRLGRRRSRKNDARLIDIDIVMLGAAVIRTDRLAVPHPRFPDREFVLAPLRELGLPWVDPGTGEALNRMRGMGGVCVWGRLY